MIMTLNRQKSKRWESLRSRETRAQYGCAIMGYAGPNSVRKLWNSGHGGTTNVG
jgi:hypothetical protein